KVAPMSRPSAFRWGGLLALAALALGGGSIVVVARALAWPAQASPPPLPPDAGLRVESVLAQLFLREAGLSARQDPLVLAAEEVNAFLARHVEVRDAPVWPVRVQVYPEEVELGGPTTLGRLVEESTGATLAGLLPTSVAERPVWVAARGTVAVVSRG